MRALIEREFEAWRHSTFNSPYLGLPPNLFTSDCPPMISIGGRTLTDEHPRLLVVSLEPLLDLKTFPAQLKYLRASEEDDIARAITWQLDYFNVFPSTLTNNPPKTQYWGDISALVRGWCLQPHDEALVSWALLGSVYVELPLIPLHARSHTGVNSLPSDSRAAVRALFAERLNAALSAYCPAAVLALGADCVIETRTALNAVGNGIPVPVTPYHPRFGKVAARYEREIRAFEVSKGMQGAILFLRGAPFTNRHRPNRVGIYETGTCLRQFLDTI